jgi:hypothetical protein
MRMIGLRASVHRSQTTAPFSLWSVPSIRVHL